MTKTVYFFGAGVSVPFGYPTTKEIMTRIFESGRRKPTVAGTTFETLFRKIVPGFRLHSTSLGVVDVLSLLDYSIDQQFRLFKSHKQLTEVELRRLIEVRLIAKWQEISFSGFGTGDYKIFSNWVKRVLSRKNQSTTFISSNYDYELEHAIFELSNIDFTTIDHGFSWRDPSNSDRSYVYHRPTDPACSLFKIHGSVNWLQCPSCKHIYINQGQIAGLTNEKCHCGFSRIFPLLVAPSLIRGTSDPNLQSIWQASMEALRTADKWVIAGYSLPPEDINIRSMLIRAYNNRDTKNKPLVTVVQIDNEAKAKYTELFPNCDYVTPPNGFIGYCKSQLI